uniref:Immunoglobulin domain-containing protein n=1 Tax=Oreochromis niloticus TaxID=8128 RepID=A0A669EFB9_ORENI
MAWKSRDQNGKQSLGWWRMAELRSWVIHVSGYEGADVNVSCSYEKGFQSSEKYLCKSNCGRNDVLIMTTQPKNNKYSIYDDKKAQIFTVTIFDLQKRDAGKYWCGISLFGNDIYTEVIVDVKQGKQNYLI